MCNHRQGSYGPVNSITAFGSPRRARVRSCIATLAILGLSLPPMAASAACKLGELAELPVTMSNSRPVITAKINGEDARFIADSGAFYSMLTEASAAEFKLRLKAAPFGLYLTGVGGRTETSIATVKEFTLAGIPVHDVEFLVGGSAAAMSENVGLLGQNFFRIGDVEYDLAKGTIRLMRAEGCGKSVLAYWVKPSEPYSIMDIEWATSRSPHTTGVASINGAKIRVLFDTGADRSILSLRAAERAGIKPDSDGVVAAGSSTGIGRARIKTYIGRFSSFKIGEEEIRNARLFFGDVGIDSADMLIGADFFLSHRIYVASSQHKLYFTYNGGPVFNLTASAGNTSTRSTADTLPDAKKQADELPDAAAYSRRGAAFASRHDYTEAIADLTRACELDSNDPDYFYQRGIAYRDNKQIDLARADFDRALELKPDDLSALEARAKLRLEARDMAGARADLDSADRAAPKEADIRLFLARGYQSVDLLPASIAQYDLWIPAHAADSRMPEALGGRCWVRAVLGEDLAKALGDCNTALKLSAKSSNFAAQLLNARGLVRLRLGDFDKAISDYDASLQILPKNAWSLYGRGIARLRKHKSAEGEADMSAATAINAPIAKDFNRYGIVP
jgi:tetratricopeptide (TPR) repeat protein/predicted aspartyl protease